MQQTQLRGSIGAPFYYSLPWRPWRPWPKCLPPLERWAESDPGTSELPWKIEPPKDFDRIFRRLRISLRNLQDVFLFQDSWIPILPFFQSNLLWSAGGRDRLCSLGCRAPWCHGINEPIGAIVLDLSMGLVFFFEYHGNIIKFIAVLTIGKWWFN